MNNDQTSEPLTDAEYLRTAVSELNESIAYLSQMVLQLQRSINEQKKVNKKPAPTKKEPPATIH